MITIRDLSRRFVASFTVFAAFAAQTQIHAAPIVLDQFEDGVNFTLNNIVPMPNNSWMCVDVDFGTEAAESMLDGSKAMKITDPGAGNGLYAIFPGVVPENGSYFVRCKMKTVEIGTNAPFSSYMLGCTVDGGHRVDSNVISSAVIFERAPSSYFSGTQNDSSKPSFFVQTPSFSAAQGADIRVMLSTNTNYTSFSSANWFDSYILIDEVVLFQEGDTVPVSLSNWTLE